MPRSRITAGFFRIQMLVVLGLSVVAALSIGQLNGEQSQREILIGRTIPFWLCMVLAVCAFVGSVLWTLDRRRSGTVVIFLVAAVSGGALLISTISFQEPGSVSGWLHPLSELSGAFLLGAAVTGMLLGHWYLTAPTMSISPLKQMNVYFGAATLARLALASVGLWLAWNQLAGDTHRLWLALRWTAGLFGPLVLVLMVWRILKHGNTQSATGVLFVGVILTFIGELTAVLLHRELGVAM